MTQSPTANWNYPTAVKFGAGRIKDLPAFCKENGFTAPLLVTDPFLATQPMVHDALAALKGHGLAAAVFSDIKPNPVDSNIEAGLKAYRSGQHDSVIAFGGGSALDAGKVIAFMAGQTRPMWDFEDIGDWWTRADPHGIAPVIAVPTTAGTGSEVGRAGHTGINAYEESDFSSGDDAESDDLRSGIDGRHAAKNHIGHRHGCIGALS